MILGVEEKRKIIVKNLEEKRPDRLVLKENVQMCLEEIEYEGVSWSHLAQGRIWY
jgi:hypothetical protein